MPRPTTKTELIISANENFNEMWELIGELKDENANLNFGDVSAKKEAHWKRDKNVRDILIHLYEWHNLMIAFVNSNTNGEAMSFLPAPYTWKTYGDMNVEFWVKHQNTSLDIAKKNLQKTHDDILTLADNFSESELFEKKHFAWTGTTNLGSYFVSTLSSHYDWAIKKLKSAIKNEVI
jgi:hypothetical protein